MNEADRADHSRAKLDHDLIVPITICTSNYRIQLTWTMISKFILISDLGK